MIAFFALLLAVDWFLYFRHAGHFFQGDSIFLLSHRARSFTEYLREFVELNPSGWYRPLANELIQSLFYPIAGLNPVPYRIPVYAVFFIISIAVYGLATAITGRRLAGILAATFFSIHATNAYTTYDVGFMPELLYTGFYVGATLTFFRYLQTQNKRAYRLSWACFVAALLSKEAAVTLPGVLFLASVFFEPRSDGIGRRLIQSIRSIAPHIIILVLYLGFAVGYLDVQSLSIKNLVTAEQVPNPGDYIPVLNGGVFRNADLAFSWAFNIPRKGFGPAPASASGDLTYLKLVRILVLALAIAALIRSRGRLVVFGFAWFWITSLPALPLVGHFIPYYLFLPVVGWSLVVAVGFVWLYDLVTRFRPFVAATTIVLIFAGVLFVTNRTIQAEIETNRLLGGSSIMAANTLNDLKRMYPTLPPDTLIYFADAREPVQWDHDSGALIGMAYGVENPNVFYESRGDAFFPDVGNVLVFSVRNTHLVDETAAYRLNPMRFVKFANSNLSLDVSASEVTSERDNKYTITVAGLKNVSVRIAYNIDDGPVRTFTAPLNLRGQITYQILPNTPKGVYKFWAFAVADSSDWVRAERTLVVR